MKQLYKKCYILLTLRGQLMLLIAFISLNVMSGVNYVCCENSNIIGEFVGLYLKLQEDPTFVPEDISQIQKAYLLEQYAKEKAAFEGTPPRNLIPFPPGKEPLLTYNSKGVEGSNLKQILGDLQNGGVPVHKAHERKFIHILTELTKLELKYKNAGMDQHDAMLRDVHKIFINPYTATPTMYPDLNNLGLRSNQKFFIFQEEFLAIYMSSEGNPLVLEAITVYNKNIVVYNHLLTKTPVNLDLKCIAIKIFMENFVIHIKNRFLKINK